MNPLGISSKNFFLKLFMSFTGLLIDLMWHIIPRKLSNEKHKQTNTFWNSKLLSLHWWRKKKSFKLGNKQTNLIFLLFSLSGLPINMPDRVSFDSSQCKIGDVTSWQPFEDSKEFPFGVIRCQERFKKLGAVCVY
jgi:hypothetical protein